MALKPIFLEVKATGLRPILQAPVLPTKRSAWRFHFLLEAPHRLAFFAGAVMLFGVSIWWLTVLMLRFAGVVIPWAVAPSSAHALLMSMGFVPLFFVGFLFTAGPKWLGMPQVSARNLLVPVVTIVVGWLLCLIGIHAGAVLAGIGVMLVAFAWSNLTYQFMRLWRKSPSPDIVHASLILLSCLAGAIGLWAVAIGWLTDHELWVRAATQACIWCFVASVFYAVSHRMLPFFSASAIPVLDAWRPMWLLGSMVAVMWLEGLGASLDILVWPSSEGLQWTEVGVEALSAGVMLWMAVRWGLLQSLKIRLLAMLHIGFFWLGVTLALQAISHTLMALSHDHRSLGLAPMHALTIGYLSATMFAMTTRVSSGHGGRPLAADNVAWALYWILQLAACVRVYSAIDPQAGEVPLLMAIAAWCIAMCGWSWRYGNWFVRPRLDGRPG